MKPRSSQRIRKFLTRKMLLETTEPTEIIIKVKRIISLCSHNTHNIKGEVAITIILSEIYLIKLFIKIYKKHTYII